MTVEEIKQRLEQIEFLLTYTHAVARYQAYKEILLRERMLLKDILEQLT